MPKINLAQETMRNQVVARRRKMIYVVSSVLIIIVAAVYFGGYFLTKNVEGKVSVVNQRVSAIENQLMQREPGGREIKAFSSRLVNVKTILNNHTRWSQVFAELERLVLPNVVFKNLKGGTEEKLVTVSVDAPTIEAAADLVMSLQNAIGKNDTYFDNITASALSSIKETNQATASGFSTTLKLNVKPDAFKEAIPAPESITPLTP